MRASFCSLVGLMVSKYLPDYGFTHLPPKELVLGLEGDVVLGLAGWGVGQEMVLAFTMRRS